MIKLINMKVFKSALKNKDDNNELINHNNNSKQSQNKLGKW